MYLLVLSILIFSFICNSVFGRYLGKFYVSLVAVFCIILTWLITLFLIYEVIICGYCCNIKIFNWLFLGILNLPIELFFDSLTVTMLFVVLTVSTWVHIYSIEYMALDPHFNRFISYLTLFTIFMLILITSSNFVQIFIGWEGVGLASYLLINFWFNRIEANRSAIKAVILNRFGDFSLYLALLLLFFIFKTFNFSSIFLSLHFIYNELAYFLIFGWTFNIIGIIALLLFIAAAGKSAQLGLHVWLPDAMEGPTPVSALIHAATMVTAGVFLLIRSSFILEYSQNVLLVILIFGSLTAFFSSTIGLVQNDIKKVIAYSTCSQLGYMVFACGSSSYVSSLFHLFNHAFFKALLFLGAGAIIHSMSDEQDLRKYGSLVKILPFSYIAIFIGSLALIGFPFLSGFYSKDLIIESAYALFSNTGLFAYWLGTFSVFFTAFYSVRLIYLTFFNKVNANKLIIENSHESGLFITSALFFLIFFSVLIGYVSFDIFFGIGSDIFCGSIISHINHRTNFIMEFLPFYIKLFPLVFTFFGALSALYFYLHNTIKYFFNYNIFYFSYVTLSKKWFFDLIYFNIFVKTFLNYFFHIFFKVIDRGFIELIGPLGIIRILNVLSFNISKTQTGIVFYYFNLFLTFLSISIIHIFGLLNFSNIFLFIYFILLVILLNKKYFN